MHLVLQTEGTILRLNDEAVEVETLWFHARVPSPPSTGERHRLSEELLRMQKEDAGHVKFRTEDGTLELTFAMAKREELHLSVRLQNSPDYLNEVRVFLNLRRGDLEGIAGALVQNGTFTSG